MRTKLKITFSLVFVLVLTLILSTILCYAKNNVVAHAIDYADSDKVVSELLSSTNTSENEYDLSKTYPVITENQQGSNLCWTFASLKSLETSLMVQASEFKNFADVGMAFLAYKNGVTASFNAVGNFEDFCITAQNYGFIYESDFSNDKYIEISDDPDNTQNYEYLLEFAVPFEKECVLPLNFNNSAKYIGLSRNEKINTIKKYIKTKGGLFAGLEAGTYYDSGLSQFGMYKAGNSTSGETTSKFMPYNHAVCIIGWNNEFGWLAVNSWGVKNKIYEKFYIPFDYDYTYNTLSGFLYNEAAEVASFESENLTESNALKNVFSLNAEFAVSIKINESVDFDSLYFAVFKGQQDVTGDFISDFNSSTKTINLSFKPAAQQRQGTYLVKIYSEGKLVAVKEILIESGTEISYFELFDLANLNDDGTVMLQNSFLSNEKNATFYVDARVGISSSYKFGLLRNRLSSNNISVSVSEIYLTNLDASGAVSKQVVDNNYNLNVVDFSSNRDATISFNFASTTYPPNGKMVEFKMSVGLRDDSTIVDDYYIKIIISNPASGGSITTKNAYSIEYVLDGGKNNENNINRYPNYSLENNMTAFKIYPATKTGYEFVGWYLDTNFTTAFNNIIDSRLSGDLVLYAKFSRSDLNYFTGEFSLAGVTDYNGNAKTTGNIIYGDSIALSYNFTEQEGLKSANYLLKVSLVVNDNLFYEKSGITAGNQNFDFDLEYPELGAGEYNILVKIEAIISRQFSVTKQESLTFSVEQKLTSINFKTLSVRYNGKAQQPSDAVYGGVYKEDYSSIECVFDRNAETYVDSYEFNVIALSNENYKLEGNTKFTFEILPCRLIAKWEKLEFSYDGTAKFPTVSLLSKDESMSISGMVSAVIGLTSVEEQEFLGIRDVGSFDVKIKKLTNANFEVVEGSYAVITIKPAKLIIDVENIRERLQTSVNYRKQPTYSIKGTVFGEDQLGITLSTEAITATKSGKYPIVVTCTNNNYELEVRGAVYTLVGTYKVFYSLPNGEIYEEEVEDDRNPVGINNSIYKLPPLCAYSYNKPLEYTGDDIYVTVSVINYSWTVIVAAIILVFVVIYVVVTHKLRKNKVR